MKPENAGKGGVKNFVAAACVFVLVAGFPSLTVGASKSVETVTYTPREYNFQVSSQGIFAGDNSITFSLSRRDKSKRCRKIDSLLVAHDPNPVFGVMHQGDYIVGSRELNPPLCNFKKVEIVGQPFLEADVNAVCFDTPMRTVGANQFPSGTPRFVPGRSSVLTRELTIAFQLEEKGQVLRKGVPRKKVSLQANVQCVERPVTSRIGPVWGKKDTLQRGGGTGAAPARTAGSDFSGRQFTPVDRRTTPVTPMDTGTTRPEVVPRDPGTRPQSSPGSGSSMPDFTPRTPGSKPGAAGPPPLPEPACNMNGIWRVTFGQNLNFHWNFSEIDTGRYEVATENLENNDPPPLPFGSGNSACIKPTAILSGSRLLFFSCGEHSASFFEGTVDGSCYKVNGRHYSTSGHVIPATLTRSRNLRIPVPGSKP